MTQIDCVVVGGGIVGLLSARSLKIHYPHLEIALFEQEHFLGHHNTGRNSGVLHAGLYYPTNSQKHIHCLEGNRLWREELSQSLEIPVKVTGKFIVGQKGEEEAFENLRNQALNNGVQLEEVSTESLAPIQDYVNCDFSFYSINSGIIDVTQAVYNIGKDLENRGVILLKNQRAELLGRNDRGHFEFSVDNEIIKTHQLINCAGLEAINLRQKLGLEDFSLKLVKGNYLKTTQKFPLKSLVYPVPPKDLKGLGVHITFDYAGDFRFGPNTEDISKVNYEVNENLLEEMWPAIKRVFRNVDKEKLTPDYAGIRTKLYHKGEATQDFYLGSSNDHGIPGYYEFLGIESPGLTSAPSLAEFFAGKLFSEA